MNNVVTIILVVVVVAAIALGVMWARRRSLRNQFGPEYDRAVSEQDSRSAAERELRERQRRHDELELRTLDPASRDRYATAWRNIQERFVEQPGEAVTEADDLVSRLIAERGYPGGDYDEQVAHLSVEHARTLGHYRDAHEINLRHQRGEASTEQLRQALVHYRTLFADLLEADPTLGTDHRSAGADRDVATDATTAVPAAHAGRAQERDVPHDTTRP